MIKESFIAIDNLRIKREQELSKTQTALKVACDKVEELQKENEIIDLLKQSKDIVRRIDINGDNDKSYLCFYGSSEDCISIFSYFKNK